MHKIINITLRTPTKTYRIVHTQVRVVDSLQMSQGARLFERYEVDHAAICDAVNSEWGLKLGDALKISQNHTFAASNPATTDKFVVRVTPDPSKEAFNRITDELFFVRFLVENGLNGVCKPVQSKYVGDASSESNFVVQIATYTICVNQWAQGSPIDFFAYRWMREKKIVTAQGIWLAQLHDISIQFTRSHPSIAARMRRWDSMHKGILHGIPLHKIDEAALLDPNNSLEVGIIHGDLNVSNFFIVEENSRSGDISLSVFDWDQVQWAWFEYDLAQALLACLMLVEGGAIPNGESVPEAALHLPRMQDWLIEGYESVRGPGAVNRARLTRMLQLKKSFYSRFCAQAAAQGDIPADMVVFIAYVNRWMVRCPPREDSPEAETEGVTLCEENREVFTRTAPPPDAERKYGEHPDHTYDLYSSPAVASSGNEVIFLIHGGFWRPEYDRLHIRAMAHRLAAATGWAVVVPEYRREPGRPDLCLEDLELALKDLREYFPTPMVILAGHSAGGHLALCLAQRGRQLGHGQEIRGVLALAPVSDLLGAQNLDLDGGAVRAFLGGSAVDRPDLDPAVFADTSNLTSPFPKVAVIHGEKDIRVPVSMSMSVWKGKDEATVKLCYLPDIGHFELIDPENSVAWEHVMSSWKFLAT